MNTFFLRQARLVAVGVLAFSLAARANEPPEIRHQPVKAAIRGQPISVMARVTDDAGPVKYVTLFYSLSRDAAPFRVPMKASDADLYVGTIPPDLLADVEQVLYYIEAMDADEATQETAWNTIDIRSASSRAPAEEKPVVAPVAPTPPPKERSSLLGVGLIAGGAAAVAGAAILIANTDDSSSDNDDDGEDYSGVYQGNVTECFAPSGQTQSCETRSMVITVYASGDVRSTNLRSETLLTGRMNGNKFLLVAEISGGTNGVTGEVYYDGTIVDRELFGRITGREEGPGGSGVYSGSFDATRSP